ncbi:hypothetical protein AJ87_23635 [Rhizobium yanglingense]|nr:hypothetical protein AJ87_23635 [Rhizobium yanglingense]
MRGADDAGLEGDGRLATKSVQPAVLHQAEQLDLQRRGHVADLVKKKDAVAGPLGVPPVKLVRAREGSLLVSEELAFQELGRNRGAVDRHERRACAPRSLMQEACADLLAGSRLPLDENGQRVRGVAAQDHLRVAHRAGNAEPAFDGTRRARAQARRNPIEKGGHLEGLRDEVHRAAAHQADGLVDVAISRHEQEGRRGLAAALAEHVLAVHVR